MLLNCVALWNELVRLDRRRARHPLADPLEGAEWRGLMWVVPLVSRLVSGRRRARKTRWSIMKIQRVEKFNGSSRSLAG